MTNSNNDIEELEELLTELEGQEARIVTPYSEEDDAVTRLMDAPLGDQDWMVQVTALDRRMMSTSQVLSELQTGKINGRTLVWRGGMDDWLPVSRIDELARASAPPVSMPRASAVPIQRPAFTNLAPPPPPPPAQPSQPLWSSPGAPLPPPPIAMSPPIGIAPGGALPSSVGLPPPPMALTPPPPPPNPGYGVPKPIPVAALPAPAALPSGNSFGSASSFSSGNTTRPVAIDFSDVPDSDPPMQSKRWVMGLSAVAILAVFVTVYSLSSGGGEEGAKQAAAAEPRAVNALQPASSGTREKPAANPAPTAAPAARAEAAAAEEPASAKASARAEAEDEEEESASERSSASSARQNAPARYAMRSEYRRRTRGASGAVENTRAEEPEEPAPAAASAVAAPSSASEEGDDAPSSEAVAAVADEVDEPPKSTGKSGNTFNREAAKSALDEAAAQAKNCRPQGGPSGSGRVQVRYEPSGKVANVAILTSKFDNTTTGSCVRMLFRRAKVPEFTGAPVVVVNKSFEIP